jgi:hypothetical protein
LEIQHIFAGVPRQVTIDVANKGIQVRFLRSIRNLGAVSTVVALLMGIAASSAMADETKIFTGQKDCSTWAVTRICVITASNVKILLNAIVHYDNVVYLPSTPGGPLDHFTSPVTLTATDKRESVATGRCTFYFAGQNKGVGHCNYWTGTDRLAGFHAVMLVLVTPGQPLFSLTGTYWFDRDHHGDDATGGD